MALSALAPSERNEHLIYAMLPVALSFYLSLVLKLSDDPRIWVGFVTITAPLMIVILYESGIDNFLVNQAASQYVKHKHIATTRSNIGYFRGLLPHKGLDPESIPIETLVENTLSSYSIRKIFWRVRASLFLIPTVLVIVNIPFIFEIPREVNGETMYSKPLLELLPLNTNLVSFTLIVITVFLGLLLALMMWKKKERSYIIPVLILFVCTILVLIFDMVFYKTVYHSQSIYWEIVIELESGIIVVNLYRHRNIFENISNMIEFLYLYDRIVMDSIINGDDYSSSIITSYQPWKVNTRTQLDYLDKLLIRGDWAVFNQSWSKTKEGLEKYRK
ncbi:MAG: hypothetical protein ACFFF4_06845 [Candidatus Thorarchaeota archaeon]